MAVTIAQLRAVIDLDTGRLDRGVDRAEQRIQRFAASATKLGASLSVGITAPLAALGARAIAVAGDLEQSLNVLAATSGATGAQMAQLSSLAEKLGADIALPGTSAADAAKAMLELSKGGLSVADTMASARSVLQLSAAAQIDNARAAEIVADSLAQFSLAGSEASKVSDLLAGAANASTGSIDQMAQALAQSGTAFAQLGVPIEDAVTSISLLAKAGIKGSDAGTSLKTAIMRLNPTTKEAKAVMDKLKISFFDSRGEFVGMQKAAEILNTALSKLSRQNQQTAISLIGGTDAMRALNVVANAGADGFDRMRQQVSKAGSAADLAEAENKGLRGALDALQSSIDTALNAAVKPFLGDLTRMAKRAAELAGKFGELDTATQKSLVFGAAGAALAGPALLSLGALATALRALLPVFAAVRVAAVATWAAISGPLAPLTLLVLGVATAIAIAWEKNWGNIRETVAGAWQAIQGTINTAISAIKNSWGAFLDFLTGEWGSAWDKIKKSAVQTASFLADVVNPARFAQKAIAGAQAAISRKVEIKLADFSVFPGATEAAKRDAEKAFRDRIETAKRQAAAVATAAKETAATTMRKPPHIPGLFDDLAKKAKEKLTPLQQQLQEFSRALREATTEQQLLLAGASESAIRIANQFNLVNERRRAELLAIVERNEALRKERDATRAVGDAIEQMRLRLRRTEAATLQEKLAIDLFKKSIEQLNTAQLKRLAVAEQIAIRQERIDAIIAKGKKAVEERERAQQAVNSLADETARKLDLLRDGSLENQIAWDKFGISISKTTGLMRHRIIAEAQAQRMTEMHRQTVEAAQAQLEAFGQVILGLGMGFEVFDEEAARAAAAAERFAEQVTHGFGAVAELQHELAVMKTTTEADRIALKQYGVVFAALPPIIQQVILAIIALKKEMAGIDKHTEAIKELARGTQAVFEDAFLRLDEGFGSFFKNVIAGFERMLQEMAAKFLAAQLTKALFGLFGATADVDAGPIAGLQRGGPIAPGQSFLVGEQGPELFTPRRAGRIIPNEQLAAGGGNITINFNISTPDAASFRRSQSQLQADALRLAQQAQKRNG